MAEKYKSKFTGYQIDAFLDKAAKLSRERVKVGTVTTAPSGSQATVETVYNENDTILNFTIPKGDSPQRGVDYWTGADKAEIKADVDPAVSAANAAAESANAAAASAEAAAAKESARANQTFANALRGSASGNAVALTDVSPVSHTLDVNVRSKNLFDISKVESTTGLTNNGDGTLTVTKYGIGKTLLKTICPGLKAGYAYTLIIETTGANLIYLGEVKQNWYSGKSLTITEDMLNSTALFYCKKDGTVFSEATISNIQIELGTTATGYTPYISPTAVVVKRCGKNLFNPNIFTECGLEEDSEGAYYGNSSFLKSKYVDKFNFIENTQYAISFYGKASSTEYPGVSVRFNYTDGTNSTYGNCEIKETNYTKHTVVSDPEKSVSTISFSYGSGIIVSYIKNFMLEIGGAPTAYEPYIADEYTPNADGAVDGVTSLYPNTTLVTDTKEVAITVDYNRDINKSAIYDNSVLSDRITAAEKSVNTLIDSDKNKSVRTIANEELAAQLIPESAKESLDTLQEIATWIQSHPDDASAMNADLTALKNKLSGIDNTVKQYVDDAIEDYVDGQTGKTIYIDSMGRGVNQSDGSTYSLTTIYSDAHSNLDRYRFVYVGGADYKSTAPISAKSGYDNYANDAIILTAILDDDYAGLNYLKAYWYLSDARVTWTSKSIYNPDPCLIEGTPIDMADGTTKAVEDVRTGDIVQSYDPATGEMTPAVVIGAYLTGESRNYAVYSFTNGKYLTVYGMHGIYSKGKGTTKDIRKITRDDKIVSIDGSIVQWIKSSDTFFAGEKKRRFNVVTSNNLYFANGILLGHKPYSKLQYALDIGLTVPNGIRTAWQEDADAYNAYSDFLSKPEYHAEIAEASNNLSRANHIIAVNKQRLTNSDYLVQKFTEGLLSLGEWTAAKAKRATWRKEVNDNEVLRDESKATVDAIIAKYRGGKTPRSIFESCCARDNALFDTVRAYFAGGDGA